MLFSGMLRGDYRFDKLRPPLWFSTEYVFDKSPDVKLRWAVMSEGAPKDDEAFLAWTAKMPYGARVETFKAGKRLSEGPFNGSARSAESSAQPDAIAVYGEDEAPLLSFKSIKHPAEAPTQNVFVHGDKLFIAWLDKSSKAVKLGKWYETSMSIAAPAKEEGSR